MELELQVPEIPKSDGLVRGARGEDELGVGVEAEAVDLGGVGVHGVAGPVGHRAPRVPDHQLLVIRHRAEQGLVQQVPGHVLHHSSVP